MKQTKVKPALYLHDLPPQWQRLHGPLAREKITAGMEKGEAERMAERELLRSYACKMAPTVKTEVTPSMFGDAK